MKIILYEDKAYTRPEIVAIFGEEYIAQVENLGVEQEDEFRWSTQTLINSGKIDEFACHLCVCMQYNFENVEIEDVENVEDYPWEKALEGYYICTSRLAIHDMYALAELINDSEDYPLSAVDNTIECNGWIDTSGNSDYDICTDGKNALVFDDNTGEAKVVSFQRSEHGL